MIMVEIDLAAAERTVRADHYEVCRWPHDDVPGRCVGDCEMVCYADGEVWPCAAETVLAEYARRGAALAGTTTPTGEPNADTIEKLAGAIYACDAEPPLNARTVPERWAVYQAQARNIVWPVVAALLASTPTAEESTP